jgi:hypothetical protein
VPEEKYEEKAEGTPLAVAIVHWDTPFLSNEHAVAPLLVHQCLGKLVLPDDTQLFKAKLQPCW